MHLNVIEGNKRLIRIAYYNRVTLKNESETIIELNFKCIVIHVLRHSLSLFWGH